VVNVVVLFHNKEMCTRKSVGHKESDNAKNGGFVFSHLFNLFDNKDSPFYYKSAIWHN